MNVQYKLKITVINDIDTFVGYTVDDACDMELIESARDYILLNSNSLSSLILRADDDTYIALNENILKKSVIKLKIVPVGVSKE